jgi:hypothetical protein
MIKSSTPKDLPVPGIPSTKVITSSNSGYADNDSKFSLNLVNASSTLLLSKAPRSKGVKPNLFNSINCSLVILFTYSSNNLRLNSVNF